MYIHDYANVHTFVRVQHWRPEQLLPQPRGALVPLSLTSRGGGFPIPGPVEVDVEGVGSSSSAGDYSLSEPVGLGIGHISDLEMWWHSKYLQSRVRSLVRRG